MDLLNYLSGYHGLRNFEEMQGSLNTLLNCVFAIENFDAVDRDNPKTNEWRDRIVMRCRTDSYSRSHAPVLFESADSAFWAHGLFEKIDAEHDEFPGTDLCPPSVAQFRSHYLVGEEKDAWQVMKYLFSPDRAYKRFKKASG